MSRDCTDLKFKAMYSPSKEASITRHVAFLAMARNSKKRSSRSKQAGQGRKRAPMAVGVQRKQNPPSMQTRGNSICVKHRELLTLVAGTEDFQWEQHQVNPGLVESFPWLSAIANRYETYKFKKLDFEYIPRTGANTAGAITLVVDYDAADEGPNDLIDAMSYSHSVRGSAWQELTFRSTSEDRDMTRRRYTRTGEQFSVSDVANLRQSDLCSVFICTDGAPTQGLGEVWTNYEVEFFTPEVPPVIPQPAYATLQPSGDLQTSCLVGCTKTRDEMKAYGFDGVSLSNGIMTFQKPFQGFIEESCQSAANPGAFVIQGGRGADPSVPSPESGTATHFLITPSAGTTGVVRHFLSARAGNKVNIKSTNSAAAAGGIYNRFSLIPLETAALNTLMGSVGALWTGLGGL